MMFHPLLLVALASPSFANLTQRTFAVLRFHDDVLTYGRADPIISPGTQAGHVHMVQGGSNFALDMDDDTLLNSKCTSGLIKNDKSNYWVPSLYFQHSNGSFESVPMFYMNVYYFFEKTTDQIKAFPKGLRMFVGDPTKRTPPSSAANVLDLAQGTPQPIQWTCPRSNYNVRSYPQNSDGLHGVGIQDPNNLGAGVGFPDANCDGYAAPLRADIHFPSCYNPAVSVRDYKNNMAFPTNGNCPSGWIHTPHLFYEVYWDTLKFQSLWTPGQAKIPFVLSNGDNTGYSLHGDFINGWDTTTLQTIIDGCNAGDSGMDTCPNIIGGLESGNCAIPVPVPAGVTREQVLSTLDKLPGNNPVTGWGVAAAAAAGSSAPSSSVTSSAKASSAAASSMSVKNAQISSSSGSTTTVKSTLTSTMLTKTTTQTGASSAPSTVTSPQSINGYDSYGCWSDNVNRVLTDVQYANVGSKGVSNTACIAYCQAAGYSLAATEYGSQCFCGNQLAATSKQIDSSTCNMACQGSSSEICGGSWALSVWKKKGSAKRAKHVHRHVHGQS